ncbi:hypothetical protein FEP57_05998 [Burkholderia multivorans]|nr:hypothetical protein [Burkholderia multivorans]
MPTIIIVSGMSITATARIGFNTFTAAAIPMIENPTVPHQPVEIASATAIQTQKPSTIRFAKMKIVIIIAPQGSDVLGPR